MQDKFLGRQNHFNMIVETNDESAGFEIWDLRTLDMPLVWQITTHL